MLMEFANWLREQLNERPDLNQKRLAEALGVYASTVSFWLSGRSKPSYDKVGALAGVLEVDRREILQFMGVDTEPYEFKVLGPIVEEIDRMLESTPDPEDHALIVERLKNDLRAAKDTLEALNQRRKHDAP